MARSLPLQIAESSPSAQAEPSLNGTVAVFDPALCCPTGVCGPGVDPALLEIARDLRWLEAQGATVARVGLSQEPQAFVANAKVSGLLQAFGDGALPAVLVNDTVLTYGRYPTRAELLAVLTAATTPAPSGGSACAPGSGCC